MLALFLCVGGQVKADTFQDLENVFDNQGTMPDIGTIVTDAVWTGYAATAPGVTLPPNVYLANFRLVDPLSQ